MMRQVQAFGLFVGVLLVLGCSGQNPGPTLYPVTGTVTKGGKPLEGVSVGLVATNEKLGLALMGTTKEDGTFEIITGQGKKGAPEGTYKVVLSKPVSLPTDPKAMYTGAKKDPYQSPASANDEIPKEYQSPKTTTKTFEVKKGAENRLTIEL